MNAFLKQERTGGEKVASDADEILTALDALHPGEQQLKNALFTKAYPGVLRAISRKVPQKEILATLSRSGLKLHPIRYRDLLEAEHKLRNERGERICCEVCGSMLQLLQASESPSARESMNQNGQLDDGAQADA